MRDIYCQSLYRFAQY